MKKPIVPQDEVMRVNHLHSLNILDTGSDIDFDRLTEFVANIFCVPIALISLVDTQRQWFKSKVGLEANETSRDISFCGHAILNDEVFIVENALLDDRFSDNPLVVDEPSIRFYAGAPLKTSKGYKIGTLCIIDTQPREFRKQDIEILEKVASDIVSLIEEKAK
ncbi:MAG: histidine kinase [Pseudoalteromonas sp.]|nr:histidine kinase [Pseudoalteromonas sp.]|tara:strand:- start:1113 stop:1604 length:492 start_codon:yes stop_codon:yes gene_type:complete